MKNVLFMNSGGKDSAFILYELINGRYPTIESFVSYMLETDYFQGNEASRALAKAKNINQVEIPYRPTRDGIKGINATATLFWSIECQYRAIQYCLENGLDTVISGNTNVYASGGVGSTEYEEILNDLQEFLEVPLDKRVTLFRPLRDEVRRDSRENKYMQTYIEDNKEV